MLYHHNSELLFTTQFFCFEELMCRRHLQIIHGSERGEPSALLLSPLRPSFKNPPNVDAIDNGSQFTLFLTCPLLAFCQLVGLSESDREKVSFQLIHQTYFKCVVWIPNNNKHFFRTLTMRLKT